MEGKPVIPLFYRPAKIPMVLGRIQGGDFQKSYDNGLQSLLRALGLRMRRLPASQGSYRTRPTPSNPGYFIFLLDQSSAMSLPFSTGHPHRNKRMSDIAAARVNSFLADLIGMGTLVGPGGAIEIRNRFHISILGYGCGKVQSLLSANAANQIFWSLEELQQNPFAIEHFKMKEINQLGMVVERNMKRSIWIRPAADGDAPMCAALQRSQELAAMRIAAYPDSYPPIVINITAGIATDGDPAEPALQLCRNGTSDGQTLLFQVLLSPSNVPPLLFPCKEDDLPHDPNARRLFWLSSTLPEILCKRSAGYLDIPLQPGARGFIENREIPCTHSFIVPPWDW